jgi:predicted MPP superfamily phosphohydrolase
VKITRRRFLTALGIGAAGCVGSGAYAVWVEPTWLKTHEVEIPVEGLPEAFDGYVIGQLSDLHVGGGVPESLLREAVRRVVEAKPDLVALTGDYVQGPNTTESARIAGEILSDLDARDGVLAVTGNHDGAVYSRRMTVDPERLAIVTRALERAGARVLENEAVTVARGSARLRIAGFGDLWCDRFRARPTAEPVPGVTTIALSHNPDTAPALSRLGVALILCGHTHGGQVRVPLFGPPMLPVARRDLAAGLCRLGDGSSDSESGEDGRARVYVNRGVGWLRRIRFGVRPEVTVITLRAGGQDA